MIHASLRGTVTESLDGNPNERIPSPSVARRRNHADAAVFP